MKGRSKVILGSLKAVRSGPERGQRSEVTTRLLYFPFSPCVRAHGLPVSREDRSLSEDRPGERGLAVWTVGVAR